VLELADLRQVLEVRGVRVDSLSRLTLLPRSLKTLILIAVDAAIGGMAFWLSVLVRTRFIPRMPDPYFGRRHGARDAGGSRCVPDWLVASAAS